MLLSLSQDLNITYVCPQSFIIMTLIPYEIEFRSFDLYSRIRLNIDTGRCRHKEERCVEDSHDDNKDHVMKDECKKVWNEIKNCQDLTKGIIMIVFTFLSEKLYDIEMMLR